MGGRNTRATQDGPWRDQVAVQIRDGTLSTERTTLPAKDGVRLSGRSLVPHRAQGVRLRYAVVAECTRARPLSPGLCPPPARGALHAHARPSHAAMGTLDVGAVVPNVD